jgi:hypothetical protein
VSSARRTVSSRSLYSFISRGCRGLSLSGTLVLPRRGKTALASGPSLCRDESAGHPCPLRASRRPSRDRPRHPRERRMRNSICSARCGSPVRRQSEIFCHVASNSLQGFASSERPELTGHRNLAGIPACLPEGRREREANRRRRKKISSANRAPQRADKLTAAAFLSTLSSRLLIIFPWHLS